MLPYCTIAGTPSYYLHACGHTCLVSGYMLISHCVNPCTNSKTVHFCSVNECLLHCYFDTHRGICTLVLHCHSIMHALLFLSIIHAALALSCALLSASRRSCALLCLSITPLSLPFLSMTALVCLALSQHHATHALIALSQHHVLAF